MIALFADFLAAAPLQAHSSVEGGSLIDALQYPLFQRALLVGLLASIACGVVGSFVVVKRITSLSGGLSHAAFGGVGLGYWLGFPPLLGAAGFALLCGLGIGLTHQRMRSALDTLISIVWSTGMALGILFVALSGRYGSDLLTYLFGSILFVPADSVVMVAVLDGAILLMVVLLFRELRAICFDEEFARALGLPVERLFLLLMVLVSLAVVVLINVVGIILVIALLTVPAATARLWVDRLASMMVLATLLSAACTTSGLFLSYGLSDRFDVNIPPGPVIILLSVLVYGCCLAVRGRRSIEAAG
jgi:zinc transport system permease protein